jgi:hypothetical protein
MLTSRTFSSRPSSNASRRGGPGLAVFGCIFALAGFAFLIPVFLLPMIHIIEALNWRSAPCTILESRVLPHASHNGVTYSIDVRFKYSFDNVLYEGTRYDFSIGSSDGIGYRQAIVRRLHPGAHTVCYVNPTNPSESVVDRGMYRDLWFGLLPLLFVIIGVSIVVVPAREAHATPASAAITDGSIPGDPSPFRQKQSPLANLAAFGVFVVFWNGILSVFIRQAYFAPGGGADWFLWVQRIFLIPFILIGLLTIAIWLYQLFALLYPRPHHTEDRSFRNAGAKEQWKQK